MTSSSNGNMKSYYYQLTFQLVTLWEGPWKASVVSEKVPFHFKMKIRTSSALLHNKLLEHIHDYVWREDKAMREGKVLVQTLA